MIISGTMEKTNHWSIGISRDFHFNIARYGIDLLHVCVSQISAATDKSKFKSKLKFKN